MKKNKIAQWLKLGSIVIFIFAIIGASVISNKETTKLVEAEYSFEDDKYETVSEFDIATFVSSVTMSAMGCLLIYAFGELIQLQENTLNAIKENQITTKQNNEVK